MKIGKNCREYVKETDKFALRTSRSSKSSPFMIIIKEMKARNKIDRESLDSHELPQYVIKASATCMQNQNKVQWLAKLKIKDSSTVMETFFYISILIQERQSVSISVRDSLKLLN